MQASWKQGPLLVADPRILEFCPLPPRVRRISVTSECSNPNGGVFSNDQAHEKPVAGV